MKTKSLFPQGFVWVFVILAEMFVFQLHSAEAAEPTTVSTYHCLSLYWTRGNGGACEVDYRVAGSSAWLPAQNLAYDSTTKTPLQNQYRGSIVNLKPGTSYEVRLTVGGTSKVLSASTRSEKFKIMKTIKVGNRSNTFKTTEGGSASGGYVLYDGTGSTIDPKYSAQNSIYVSHSYVIIRGFTVKGSKNHAVLLNGNIHDVVVENCDISNWGSLHPEYPAKAQISNQSGGIMVMPSVKRVTIQRCKVHNPRYRSCNWNEFSKIRWGHPTGTVAIKIGNSDSSLPWTANHVVRYNEVYSDSSHKFEDAVGGYPNYSKTGFPGADSDIYGNVIKNPVDDTMEADGGGQNVRIWGNYMESGVATLSLQSCTVGPVYIFRNVFGKGPGTLFKFAGNNYVYKTKLGSPEAIFWGPVYVYHNTTLDSAYGSIFSLYNNDDTRNVTSRNNVWISRNYVSGKRDNYRFINCSFDYDLHTGGSTFNGGTPADYDKHGFKATPVWRTGNGPTAGMTGKYQLKQGSKGYNGGAYLPNFNLGTGEEGKKPDMGAQEYDSADMVFGTKATWASLGTSGGGTPEPPPAPTTPASPSGLKATAASSTQIDLSWSDNSSDETAFKIERKKGSSGTFAQIAKVGANVKAYKDTGLYAGSTYYYRVCAQNSVGYSSFSNTVTVMTPTAATKPASPSGMAATVVSSTQINLSWSDNSNNETAFKIERKKGSTGTFAQIVKVGANVKTYKDTGLYAGSTYYYRVCAQNDVGYSSFSNTVSVKTPALAPVIGDLSVSALSGEVNSHISYQITASNSPTSFGAQGLPAGLSVDTKTGLISGSVDTVGIYSITVSATNGSGTGTAVKSMVIQGVSMAAPTNLTAVVSGSQINLKWSDNSTDESCFKVYRQEGVDGEWLHYAMLDANTKSFSDTRVQSGLIYSYRVMGKRFNDGSATPPTYSSWTDVVSVTFH